MLEQAFDDVSAQAYNDVVKQLRITIEQRDHYSQALTKIAKASICHNMDIGPYCTLNSTIVKAKEALRDVPKP